jgi:hypothetical protein
MVATREFGNAEDVGEQAKMLCSSFLVKGTEYWEDTVEEDVPLRLCDVEEEVREPLEEDDEDDDEEDDEDDSATT